MDRVIVIGGSGFMGSHTADELSKRGYKVTIFDREKSAWLREGQDFVSGDMLDLDALAKTMEGAKYLYHFGGIADIGEARQRPFDTINQNVLGATIAMEAAVKEGVERFVYASTMYVHSPYGSFYRASKQASEIIIESYSEKFEVDYTLLRYGSLYGPRAQDWNGLRKYINQVIRSGKLEYNGTGKERREYIHVLDAARLSVDVLDNKHRNQAITVTGQQILNSNELIDLIFEITGAERNVVFLDEESNNDHYVMTPYRYRPKTAKKLVPDEFIDIGQGVYDIIEEISSEIENDN